MLIRNNYQSVVGGGGMGRSREAQFPRWMQAFLGGDYFSPCHNHSSKKNERNHFCTDCMEGPLCHVGLQELHEGHNTLQVRRASHVDAVRVEDIQRFADVSNIQTYSINGAKIFFLLCRPQYKVVKEAPYTCQTCGRMVADAVKFCSLTCKLSFVASHNSCSCSTLSRENHPNSSVMAPSVEIRTKELNFDQKRFLKAFAVHLQRLSQEQWNMQKPLKKRKFDCFADHIIVEGSDVFHEDDSLNSPVSVLQHEVSMNDLQRTLHHCSQESCQWLPTNSKSRESGGIRIRRRKGQPQRSPLA